MCQPLDRGTVSHLRAPANRIGNIHHVVAVLQCLDARKRETDLGVKPADDQPLTTRHPLPLASCFSASFPSFLMRSMSVSRSAFVRLLVTPSIVLLWTAKTFRILAAPFGVRDTIRVRRSSASADRTTRP